MSPEFYYLKGSLKGNILVHLNYTYRKTKQIEERSYWRCRRGCNVSIVVEEEKLCSVRNFNLHTHEDEQNEIKILTFKQNLRQSVASNPNSLPEALYRLELSKWDMLDRLNMPQFVSIKSTMYMYRKDVLPKIPKSMSQIQMDGPWALTSDGDPFVLYNSQADDNILILGTERSLYQLCKNNLVLMDGTFKSVPREPKFKQLYTFHAEIEGKIFPLLYCLLPDMKTITYERTFQIIKCLAESRFLQFCPPTFQIDFEMATIKAIQSTFPKSKLKGCFYHFAQSIWRKLQNLGLVTLYTQDVAVKQWMRKLITLPLIPTEELDEAWIILTSESPDTANVTILLDYIVENWIDDIDARFNRTMWTHFETNLHRTTNSLESWHGRLNRDVNSTHPNFWNFISVLKSDHQYNSVKIELALQGKLLTVVKRKVRERETNFNRHKWELLTQKITLDEYMTKVSRLCPSQTR